MSRVLDLCLIANPAYHYTLAFLPIARDGFISQAFVISVPYQHAFRCHPCHSHGAMLQKRRASLTTAFSKRSALLQFSSPFLSGYLAFRTIQCISATHCHHRRMAAESPRTYVPSQSVR